jgi:hypothetical protein
MDPSNSPHEKQFLDISRRICPLYVAGLCTLAIIANSNYSDFLKEESTISISFLFVIG